MLIEKLNPELRIDYSSKLRSAGMISGLFADNSVPFIQSRMAERMFCQCFNAEDRARDDTSADATLGRVGIGIKTFINGNGKSLQKVAEFDSDSNLFRNELPANMIRIVAELRNERIEAAKRMYGLDEMIYHCVVREEGRIMVFECPMDEIDISHIRNVRINKQHTAITFNDGLNDYSFNISKSTLSKRFITENILVDVRVDIIEDPLNAIEDFLNHVVQGALKEEALKHELPHIILPLFSDRGGRNVPEKSGINQWNADGRPRNCNEIYIPIPAWIHEKFPGFFPDRDHPFKLILPDKSKKPLSAKVCQQGSKALMSNPNAALGQWLLRDVMNINEGELLTYNDLQRLNIDSVEITRLSEDNYSIDFRKLGSFDEFIDKIENL